MCKQTNKNNRAYPLQINKPHAQARTQRPPLASSDDTNCTRPKYVAYWRIKADKTGHVSPHKTYINTKTYQETKSRDHDGPDVAEAPFELDEWSVPLSVFKQHVVPHLMHTAPIPEIKNFPDRADHYEYANVLLDSFVHSRNQLQLINKLAMDLGGDQQQAQSPPDGGAPSRTSSITLADLPKKRKSDCVHEPNECSSAVFDDLDDSNQYIRDVYEEWSGLSWHTADDAVMQAPMTHTDALLFRCVV